MISFSWLALSVTFGATSPKGRGLGKKMKFAWTAKGSHFGGAGFAKQRLRGRGRLRRTTMPHRYFTTEIADGTAVLRGTDAHRTAAVRQYTVESDFQFLENGATAEEERQARELNGPTRLVAGGVTPRAVLMAAIVNAVLACVCGLAVIVITGYWWLVFVGALCVTAAWFYVGGSHPYGYFGFGELAAFVFFGPVAALGTQFVLCGQVNGNGVYGAVVIGAVSAAVMAVNNLRDVNTDRESGKRTLAVRIGARAFTVCLCVLIALVMLRCGGLDIRLPQPRT